MIIKDFPYQRKRQTRILPLLPILYITLFTLSCAGLSSGKAEGEDQAINGSDIIRQFGRGSVSLPGNVAFVSAPLVGFISAPGVGLVTREPQDLGASLGRDDRERLTGSFRDAYIEGLLLDLPLAGVLGGDMVHGWPPAAPAAWVQNWRSSEGRFNSWGTPSLLLAARGLSHDQVFLVRGEILDAYGLGGGLMGANGAAGYGAPCGDEFIYQGNRAQRFDYGIITVDPQSKPAFLPEEAPSARTGIPETTGFGGNENADPRVRAAFQSAWQAGINGSLVPMQPDTDVLYIDFQEHPWTMPVEVFGSLGDGNYGVPGEDSSDSTENLLWATADFYAESQTGEGHTGVEQLSMTIRGIYYQVFGAGTVLFVLADASIEYPRGPVREEAQLPFHAVIIAPPFLEALLSAQWQRLPGVETVSPAPLPPEFNRRAENNYSLALLEGIALYGLPLGSSSLHNEGSQVLEAQRFSRGWFMLNPEPPVSEQPEDL
jgi:hypothetical protein